MKKKEKCLIIHTKMKYDHCGLAPHILIVGPKLINIGFTPCCFGPQIYGTDDQSKFLIALLRYVTIVTFVTETAQNGAE